MAKYRVVLELEVDPSTTDPPKRWDWDTLIGPGPKEDVTLVDCEEVS